MSDVATATCVSRWRESVGDVTTCRSQGSLIDDGNHETNDTATWIVDVEILTAEGSDHGEETRIDDDGSKPWFCLGFETLGCL